MKRLIIVLLFVASVIILQFFLSKRERKWTGLVLPIIAFVFGSLLYPLNMATPSDGTSTGFVGQMILGLFIGNIPTIVLLAIYFVCRKKLHRNNQIDKMNIQDL